MNSFLNVWHVDLCLRPSRLFCVISLMLHVAAAVAVLHTEIVWPWRWLLWTVVLFSAWLSLRRERSRRDVRVSEQIGRWWLATPEREGPAELKGFRVWRYLVVMDFLCRDVDGDWRERVVVWPDAVSADSFRRLRVRLRHGRLHSDL